VNLAQLSIGTKVLLASGDRAEVVALNAEAETVGVRYLDALGEPGVGRHRSLSLGRRSPGRRHGHACGRTDIELLRTSGITATALSAPDPVSGSAAVAVRPPHPLGDIQSYARPPHSR
jgi:hypothetical protein